METIEDLVDLVSRRWAGMEGKEIAAEASKLLGSTVVYQGDGFFAIQD